MTRSAFGANEYGWFHIDMERVKDWSLDAVAKRIIAIAAFAFIVAGSLPLVTSVQGQGAQTPIEQEVRDLRQQFDKLDGVKTDLALVIAHQKLEDERYEKQQDFQSKVIWGFLGTGGGILLALFGWTLNQFGISIGITNNSKARK